MLALFLFILIFYHQPKKSYPQFKIALLNNYAQSGGLTEEGEHLVV